MSFEGGAGHPDAWMMPNRKGFPAWMHRTFDMDGYAESRDKNTFLPHQRLVRDFMHFESPYRGILLFHGLGVGKTCASIAAAEAFLDHGRKVIVMVPASLATNYRQEIMKCATFANPSLSIWNQIQVTADAPLRITRAQAKKQTEETRWIPGTPEVAATYGKVIRKNVAWNKLTSSEKEAAQSTLEELATKSFTFVNYNGLTLKAYRELTHGDGTNFFKDAFIVMDEAHNFMSRVANGGKVARKMYEDMMMTPSARLVLLTGTPVINHPFELCLLLNLVRGMIRINVATRTSTSSDTKTFTEDTLRAVLGDTLSSHVDHLSASSDAKKIYFTLCPVGFQLDKDKRMVRKDWEITTEQLERAVHHKLADEYRLEKTLAHDVAWALPTSKDEFVKMFMDVTDPEMPKVKNMDMFMRRIMGLVSYVRTTGEENFPRVTARHVEPIPMSDFQFRVYNKVRGTERTLEKKQKQQKRMSKGIEGGLFGAKGTVYRAFSRMACNFVFPDDIQRKYPMDLKKEMQRVLMKELDSLPAEDDDQPHAGKAVAPELRASEEDKKLAKQYETNLKTVMKTLKERASDILTPSSLNELYSPKMARMLEHVQSSPGKSLIYSQFRSVEGLGVLQLTLEQAGYVRMELAKKSASWTIVNADTLLDPKHNGKRYIVFDGDREKTKVMLQIFNGDYQGLPKEIWNQLLESSHKKNPTNLRGELLSVLLITQSGAEGISLKNVRRVMILEPFWNMVRMDQVIGRAVRNNSHVELPPEERTVDVYIYTTVFTQKQLEKDFTLRNLDEGLTSDAHIMRIAQNKDEIIQTFLNHMKMAALDCRNHAPKNMITRQGIRCYAYPIPVQPSHEAYLPDLARDAFHKSRMVRTRRVQGKVVLIKNKKFVVADDYPGKFFDYDAYKNAGVLEEVEAHPL